jgi:signal transduction histidine kinase
MVLATPALARTSVLVVHTYGQDQPVRGALDEGIQKSLRLSGPEGITTYFETIEIHRFPDPQYEQLMSAYLQRKYQSVHVDVIVVAFDTALNFLLRHRSDLFPDRPIVALLTSHQSFDKDLDITAIWNSLPVSKTVAAALALRPEIRRLVVVDSALASGNDVQREVTEQLKTFGNRIAVDYLKDLPLDRVVDRVRTLPPDAAVLYLRQLINEDQQPSIPRQGLEAVLRASPVPVFGISDQQIGSGIVGGVMFDSTGDGQQLGETALRIASGTRARDIPAVEGPEIPLFDWRQIERWGLRAEALPAGSRVLFREAGFWPQYGRYVLAAAIIFLLQSLLIGGLLLHRASRRRAERSLRESEEALRASAERVQDLAGRLIAAQEDERRRIAIELHDDVSQALAMLSIELDQLSQDAASSRSRSAGASTAVARIADITSSVSALSRRLHPPKLEMGLTDAVSGLCRDVSRTHSIHVEFQNSPLPPTIAPDVALCVYRITQEALHNVTKHSGAKRASVQLSASDNNLVLKIADSGKGFDIGRSSTKGLGLVNIRDRVNFLRGRLEIQSAPGAGTQLMTQIPIRSEANAASRPRSIPN